MMCYDHYKNVNREFCRDIIRDEDVAIMLIAADNMTLWDLFNYDWGKVKKPLVEYLEYRYGRTDWDSEDFSGVDFIIREFVKPEMKKMIEEQLEWL